MKDPDGCLAVIVLVVVSFGVGLGIGAAFGEYNSRQTVREQAVAAGVARWAADKETGAVVFEWVKCGGDGGAKVK